MNMVQNFTFAFVYQHYKFFWKINRAVGDALLVVCVSSVSLNSRMHARSHYHACVLMRFDIVTQGSTNTSRSLAPNHHQKQNRPCPSGSTCPCGNFQKKLPNVVCALQPSSTARELAPPLGIGVSPLHRYCINYWSSGGFGNWVWEQETWELTYGCHWRPSTYGLPAPPPQRLCVQPFIFETPSY